jgi:hypothetical protein
LGRAYKRKSAETRAAPSRDPPSPSPPSLPLPYRHLFDKGVQAGGVLTIPISLGLSLYKKEPLFSPEAWLRRAGGTTAVTIGLIAALGAIKVSTFEGRDEVDDRVYRLHYNQVRKRWGLLLIIRKERKRKKRRIQQAVKPSMRTPTPLQ